MRILAEFAIFALLLPWLGAMLLGGGELLGTLFGCAGFMTFYLRNS